MYLLIIFIPLINFMSTILFGRFIGKHGAILLSNISLLLTTMLSLLIFYNVGLLGSSCIITLGNWLQSDLLLIQWSFLFDRITIFMLLIVSFISFCVHMYSSSYMYEDPHIIRFLSYLSLFTFFMLILVTSNNFIQLFLGWEGVGLCSYLLINFWFTRLQANKAAIKAVVVNKIGDFCLLLAIGFIFLTYKTVNYSVFFQLVPYTLNNTISILGFSFTNINIICFLLFLAACGKSAQIGLHVWLPDAMEGPTPVSALIHAATMVTAGVFLIIRCSPIFEYAPDILWLLAIIGAATSIMSATIGLMQFDLKKIIAYSTCSQLGYMMFACGLSNYIGSLYHLINHAFFKALLFLCAGSIIHSLKNEQDIRRMGGLIKLLPLTYVMMLIASLALIGFPFLTGFYSKEPIIALPFTIYTSHSSFVYWAGTLTAFLTTLYSFRLIYYVFFSKPNMFKSVVHTIHEAPPLMAIPMFCLTLGSIFIGYILKEFFLGVGSNFFYNDVLILTKNYSYDYEFLPNHRKNMPFFGSVLGITWGLYLYWLSINKKEILKAVYFYASDIKNFHDAWTTHWYFNNVYNNYIVIPVLNLGYKIFILIDKGLIELFGPLGVSYSLYKFSFYVNKLHTSNIYFNLLFFVLFLFYSIFLICCVS